MSPRIKNIYLLCTYETFVECIGVQTHTGRVIGTGGGCVQGKFSTGNSLTFCNRDNTRLINHLFRGYTVFIFYPKKGIHLGHK